MTAGPRVTRRSVVGFGLMASGAAAAGGLSSLGEEGPVEAGPEAYGAVGDGRVDDTAALQAWLDAAGADARLQLRRGATYRIDTGWRPTFGNYGGLKLSRGQRLALNGAELRALPSVHPEGAVIQGYRVDDWQIVGPGSIVGERAGHLGQGGEWGMGIAAWSASNWRVRDVTIRGCWGDGVMVGYAAGAAGTFCERFEIAGARISDCRRNGISIVAGRGGTIADTVIRAIAGTSPGAGIDLEPDDPHAYNRDMTIANVDIAEANIGIAVTVANRTTTITGSRIDAGNSGVMIGDGARGLTIADNPMIRTAQGGVEGGSIRTAATDNATIDGVTIRNNTLAGGGVFVIDFAAGAHNVVVADNVIIASNRSSRIARLFTGSVFTNNRCSVTADAGAKGGYIVQLVETKEAGNSYVNRSRFAMPPLLIRPR